MSTQKSKPKPTLNKKRYINYFFQYVYPQRANRLKKLDIDFHFADQQSSRGGGRGRGRGGGRGRGEGRGGGRGGPREGGREGDAPPRRGGRVSYNLLRGEGDFINLLN